VSYILDALKKSEQERSRRDAQGAVVPSAIENSDQPSEHQPRRASAQVTLAEYTSSSSAASSNKARFSVSLVLLGMLAVVVIAVILIVNSNAKPDAPEEIGARAPLSSSATATPVQPERKTEQSSLMVPMATSRIPPPANILPAKHQLEQAEPTNTDRAPFEALERIPDLVITAHKYSTVPENRSVTMNGRTWREGDSVVDGVTLKEITRDGLALDVAGWPVVVGRSRGWKAIK
jgi:general secretion pathway protein B